MLQKEKNGSVLRLVETNEELTTLIEEVKTLEKGDFVGLDTEGTGLDYYEDHIVGYSIAFKPKTSNVVVGYYLPIRHEDYKNLSTERCNKFIFWIIRNFQTILFNRSYDFSMIEKEEEVKSIPPDVVSHDVQIIVWEATYEKYPSLKKSYRLYLKKDIESFAQTMNASKEADEDESTENSHNFGQTDPRKTFEYGAFDPVATYELFFKIQQLFPYVRIIYPLDNAVGEVLRKLTRQVFTLNYDVVRVYKEIEEANLRRLQREVFDIAGYQFKITSNRDKAEALSRFVTLTKKTKTGAFQVDIPVLENIDHPLAKALVNYSETFKFINSYISPVLRMEGKEFRINYKTVEAPTARLASGTSKGNSYYAPINIQSIPVIEEILYIHEDPILGYKLTEEKEGALGEYETKGGLRKAFVAPEGYVFVTVDYAQEELRITANLSKERTWIEAFNSGIDVHVATARTVFRMDSKDSRKRVKTMNFGLLYGMSKFALSKRLKIDVDEAGRMLKMYFQRLADLTKWMDSVKARSRKTMSTATYYGRLRPLGKYYNSSDPVMIGFADRSAINTAVQGCIPIEVSFEMNGEAVKVTNPNNLKSLYKTYKGNDAVLTHRGLNYCYFLYTKRGDFLTCDRNHILFQGGKTYKSINAVEASQKRVRVVAAKLQKKIMPRVRGIFKKGGLCKLARHVARREVVSKSKAISTYCWSAWLRRARISLSPLEAANLKSVCSVHGFNVKMYGRDGSKVIVGLSFRRTKRPRMVGGFGLGMLPVASATIRNAAPIYQAQGFENRNTAADVLRIKLCELYQKSIVDEEFRDNVIICWSVHDEIEFYVKPNYLGKAVRLIPQLMKVVHDNWQVPLVVELGIGYSWGTCVDGVYDKDGKILDARKAKWYEGMSPKDRGVDVEGLRY